MTLKEKIFKIITDIGVVAKGDKAFNYNYTSKEAIMVQIKPKLKKLRVMCQPSIVPGTLKIITVDVQGDETIVYEKADGDKPRFPTKVTRKNKTEVIVAADAIYRWTDLDTGETLDVPWVIVGQMEDAAQAFGAGMTYCDRYFWMETLNIVSTEDVDRFRSGQKETELRDIKVEISALGKELIDAKRTTTDDIKKIIASCSGGTSSLTEVSSMAVAEKILAALIQLKNK